MNLQELKIEQRCRDIIDKKLFDVLTEKENKIKTYIDTKMWKLIYDNIPQQGYCDKQSICKDAVENIFIDNCKTRLEALKFALKLKNSCDICDEISDYINDDYTLECWSEKSLRVYQDCLETYFAYHGDELTNYKEIKNAARIGAYCFIEKVAVETINTLADIAEELGIDIEEEE